jgi:2-dehydro-3-deoxyphosphooctonate aldolase (KDO 8-P synthase)
MTPYPIQPMKTFSLTPTLEAGDRKRLLIFSGPCQIESLDHSLFVAEKLQEACFGLPIDLVFKSSYDKANRTSLKGKRGLGLQEGLRILSEVKKRTSIPVLTDVHSPEEAILVAEVVDILQTPAFLCRQTELLVSVGRTGKPINVKKGQFLPPEDMAYVAEKIASTGNEKIFLCERGACFGYRDLVVDPRSLLIMKDTGYPVIFDATHSVQSMGGAGGKSGGHRRFVRPLAKAAVALGVDGIFMECHEQPERAPSDGPSMVPLSEMRSILEELSRFWEIASTS